MEKTKLADIVKGIAASSVVEETLKDVVPRFNDLHSNEEIAQELGLTTLQYDRMKKKIFEKTAAALQSEVANALLEGKGVEVPHTFLVYPQESSVRKNPDGSPKKRLTVRTRETIKRKLNAPR